MPEKDPKKIVLVSEENKKPSFMSQNRHLFYLGAGVIIFIVGLILSPTFPDELIGELILGLIIVYIETRKKAKALKK